MKYNLAFIVILLGLVCLGCTPQSVKQALWMLDESNDKAIALAEVPPAVGEVADPQLVAIAAVAKDTKKLAEPVKTYIGPPENPVPYSESNASSIASKAQADAELRVALREVMKDLVPEPVAKGFAWLESIAALIAAYGGTKISVAGIRAARKKLKG